MSVNIKVQGCPMFPVYECVFCPYNDDIEIVYEADLHCKEGFDMKSYNRRRFL
jgi:hypothetical protein